MANGRRSVKSRSFTSYADGDGRPGPRRPLAPWRSWILTTNKALLRQARQPYRVIAGREVFQGDLAGQRDREGRSDPRRPGSRLRQLERRTSSRRPSGPDPDLRPTRHHERYERNWSVRTLTVRGWGAVTVQFGAMSWSSSSCSPRARSVPRWNPGGRREAVGGIHDQQVAVGVGGIPVSSHGDRESTGERSEEVAILTATRHDRQQRTSNELATRREDPEPSGDGHDH